MTDIVERLRRVTVRYSDPGAEHEVIGPHPVCEEAADEIERLRDENKRMLLALCNYGPEAHIAELP
jgi:hypothetical protein